MAEPLFVTVTLVLNETVTVAVLTAERLVVLLPEGVREAVVEVEGLRVGESVPETQLEEDSDRDCDPHAVLVWHPVDVALALMEPQVEGVRLGVVEAQLVAVGVESTVLLTSLLAVPLSDAQAVTLEVTVQLVVGASVPLIPLLELKAAEVVAPLLAVAAQLSVLLEEAQPESDGRVEDVAQRVGEVVEEGEPVWEAEDARDTETLLVCEAAALKDGAPDAEGDSEGEAEEEGEGRGVGESVVVGLHVALPRPLVVPVPQRDAAPLLLAVARVLMLPPRPLLLLLAQDEAESERGALPLGEGQALPGPVADCLALPLPPPGLRVAASLPLPPLGVGCGDALPVPAKRDADAQPEMEDVGSMVTETEADSNAVSEAGKERDTSALPVALEDGEMEELGEGDRETEGGPVDEPNAVTVGVSTRENEWALLALTQMVALDVTRADALSLKVALKRADGVPPAETVESAVGGGLALAVPLAMGDGDADISAERLASGEEVALPVTEARGVAEAQLVTLQLAEPLLVAELHGVVVGDSFTDRLPPPLAETSEDADPLPVPLAVRCALPVVLTDEVTLHVDVAAGEPDTLPLLARETLPEGVALMERLAEDVLDAQDVTDQVELVRLLPEGQGVPLPLRSGERDAEGEALRVVVTLGDAEVRVVALGSSAVPLENSEELPVRLGVVLDEGEDVTLQVAVKALLTLDVPPLAERLPCAEREAEGEDEGECEALVESEGRSDPEVVPLPLPQPLLLLVREPEGLSEGARDVLTEVEGDEPLEIERIMLSVAPKEVLGSGEAVAPSDPVPAPLKVGDGVGEMQALGVTSAVMLTEVHAVMLRLAVTVAEAAAEALAVPLREAEEDTEGLIEVDSDADPLAALVYVAA